jgi:hypothetical protein
MGDVRGWAVAIVLVFERGWRTRTNRVVLPGLDCCAGRDEV